jgi:hypothetical protein
MFSPPLAHLQRDLAVLDHLGVTEHDVSNASFFLGATAMPCHDEGSRQNAIRQLVDRLIGSLVGGGKNSTGWGASLLRLGGKVSSLSRYWS